MHYVTQFQACSYILQTQVITITPPDKWHKFQHHEELLTYLYEVLQLQSQGGLWFYCNFSNFYVWSSDTTPENCVELVLNPGPAQAHPQITELLFKLQDQTSVSAAQLNALLSHLHSQWQLSGSKTCVN